jgi:hypothetical protein
MTTIDRETIITNALPNAFAINNHFEVLEKLERKNP